MAKVTRCRIINNAHTKKCTEGLPSQASAVKPDSKLPILFDKPARGVSPTNHFWLVN